MDDNDHKTPIQEFYSGQSIFITGSSGFVGKTLIEKLLRSCPDISKIYLLIRPKKDKSPECRLNEIFESSLYDRLRKVFPNFQDKLVSIIGECGIEDFGISDNDRDVLIREISIVFHVAATVKFNEPLKIATAINISGTKTILSIAKCMKKLKSFIHVSTVFSNCHLNHSEERFYTYPIDWETLISLSKSEKAIDESISSVISQWPNTYTCSKAIAESLIRDVSEDLPIGIFRPAILANTAREPIAGWIDNYFGPMGITAYVILGLMKFLPCDSNVDINLMPVDFTINALIASAWDVFNHPHRRGDNALIYNSVSTNDACVKYGDFYRMVVSNSWKYPLKIYTWLPMLIMIKKKVMYTICVWLFVLLPALFVDAVRWCLCLRPRMWKMCERLLRFCNAINYFCVNKWTYTDDNLQAMRGRMTKMDQQLFDFNMKGFDWASYAESHFIGIRTHLFKEDMSNLEDCRSKFARLYWIHQIVKGIFIFCILWIIWKLFI